MRPIGCGERTLCSNFSMKRCFYLYYIVNSYFLDKQRKFILAPT